ncbi:pyruvate formate-lyase [Lysinibacillus sp. 54212]|uniref:pyruvate formate-lyase n=1 Tax=Lysinibacillus sp. 54212 TaxID=3119829 RepID=UPI002FC92699
MVLLLYSIILLLLLLLIKGSMDKLTPIFTVMFFFIFFERVYSLLLRPFLSELAQMTNGLPYSRLLLYSAFLFILGKLFGALLEQNEHDALAELVQLAVRIFILSLWLKEMAPIFSKLSKLLQMLQ